MSRTFKSAWFAKAARKARIADGELCAAIIAVQSGQAVDLGGGVFKKRLDRNRQRSIIATGNGDIWVYEYLFAKKDRDNIRDDELMAFRALAKGYARLQPDQLDQLIEERDLWEICHDDEA